MTSILRAITWEFWRENRWWIIVSVSAILGLGSLVYNDPLTEYDREQISHKTAFFMEAIAFGILLSLPQYNKKKARLGFHEHLFVKPVHMRSVAMVRLGLAVITTVSLYLLTAEIFYWATHMAWPITLPCLYLTACTVFLHAIAWSLPAIPALQIVLSTIGLVVLCVRYFYHQTLSSTLGILGFIILCGALALTGAAMDRRSQRLRLTGLWSRIAWALTAVLPWKNCTNASPERALFWFHWIRMGWVMPTVSIVLMVLGYVLTWTITWTDPQDFIMIYFTGTFLLHFVGFPLLVSLITCQQETPNEGLATYTSTLPVTNRDMLLAYLKSSLASLGMSWAILVAGLCLLHLQLMIAGRGQYTEKLFSNMMDMAVLYGGLVEKGESPIRGILQNQVGYVLMAWAALGLIGSMLLSGRRSVGVTTMIIIFTCPTLIALTEILDAPPFVCIAVISLEAIIFVAGIIGGTVVAYVYGTLKKRIHPNLTACALLLYIALNLLYAQDIWLKPHELLESLALLAIVTLPLAPFATAPLALAWNRHR